MAAVKTIALFMTCASALPLHAAELSKAELVSLLTPFSEELQEAPVLTFDTVVDTFLEPRAYLAAHAPENTPVDTRPTEKLLIALRESPLDDLKSSEALTLARLGADALPLLLDELDGTDSDYQGSLLAILSTISDPRRDAKFVQLIEGISVEGGEPAFAPPYKVLLQTVASQGIREAVPAIKRLAMLENAEDWGLRDEARIALGRLGEWDLAAIPDVTWSGLSDRKSERFRPQLELVEVLVKYGLVEAPLEIEKAKRRSDGIVLIRVKTENGRWDFQFAEAIAGRVPFHYHQAETGCSVIGVGVMEHVVDRWTVPLWEGFISIYYGPSDGVETKDKNGEAQ